MTDLGAHVKPEPIEAPEPQPVRMRDLVRSRALQHGYRVMCAEAPALASYASYVAGVEAYELFRAAHRTGRCCGHTYSSFGNRCDRAEGHDGPCSGNL